MYKCYNPLFRTWLFIFSPFENRFKPYRQHQIYVYYYSWYQFGYQLFGLFYRYLLISGIYWHWDIIASPFCDTKCLSFVEYFFLCTKNKKLWMLCQCELRICFGVFVYRCRIEIAIVPIYLNMSVWCIYFYWLNSCPYIYTLTWHLRVLKVSNVHFDRVFLNYSNGWPPNCWNVPDIHC